ncbi:MAG: orotate phosphoribosyltransferase [Dehalococcoidales bacterium]|nr:orotate phosphoribosyltransferase [Dehalococcoidales bacterium]
MTENIEEMFVKSGAILKGHFLLTSGLHSPVYWEKFQVLQFPNYTEKLCGMIASHFKGLGVQVVAGPTTGGIILAFEVGRQMGVRSIFAEKEGTERKFRRGFNISPGEKVLIVDDILTTGSSIKEVISAVNKLGGDIVGFGVLVNRSEQDINLGAPLFACHRAITPAYDPKTCPLCAAKIPLVKRGSSEK